jgi:hypothetical protein
VVRKRSSPKVTIHALLLLASLSYFMLFFSLLSYPSYPYDSYSYYPYPPSSLNIILSEEIPVFQYNVTPSYAAWLEITNLQTNETPVTLSVFEGSVTLLNVTNVTSMFGFSMTVPHEHLGNFWLQLSRLESDANLNITLRCWVLTVTGPDIVSIAYPWQIAVLFVLAFLYSFYKMVTTRTFGFSGKAQRRTKRGTVLVILLLVFGVSCFFPLTRGYLHHDFIPQYTPQGSHETHSFVLNDASPSMSLELADVHPEAETSISFKVHDISISAYPILVRVSDGSQQELVLGVITNEERWWLSFTVQTNRSTTLTFLRIGTDTELELAIETSYGIYVPRVDPLIPNLLALIGCGSTVVAIGLALRIDWNYRKEGYREESYDAVPIQ